jgi:Na+-transporting NADH:ubiquinone oxidoreductase subunit A
MSAEIKITKGLDIPMMGAPGENVRTLPLQGTVSVYPSEYKKLKFKLLVAEGDKVERGTPLARRKDLPEFQICAPVAGTVASVVYGERRALQEIVIQPDGSDAAVSFPRYTVDGLRSAERQELIDLLLKTGLLALIRQRPFAHIADPAKTPKSIFVNGMKSAPFRPDANVLVRGKADALQAGLNALTRLTQGPVHLCLAAGNPEGPLTQAKNVNVNFFSGPHPAGNTSTHIYHLDPILPGDCVWTLGVSDVLRIGELLLSGLFPQRQTLMIAGPGVKDDFRGYVDVVSGSSLAAAFAGILAEGEQRIVRGDLLCGATIKAEGALLFTDNAFCVIPEDRERHLLGWYAPTTTQFSAHKVVPSAWIQNKLFSFGTNKRGGHRALVMTGIYDKYVPLDILVDPFTRACIAKDTEEAIAMGILGVEPEDFALCTFVCPSKTDFGQIVADALALIEEEGF